MSCNNILLKLFVTIVPAVDYLRMGELIENLDIQSNYKKLRILFLTMNEEIKGPIPKINTILISSLRALGCQITTHTWGHRSEKEPLVVNILGRLCDIIQINKVLKENYFDILFIPSALDERALLRELMMLFGCQSFPIRKVLLFHGSKVDHLDRPGSFALKLLTRLVLDKSDALLVLSSEEKNKFQRLFPKKMISNIDNPFIRTEDNEYQMIWEASSKKNGNVNLLFVGRLISPKGIFDLLKSMPIVLKRASCFLTIVGDGPEANNVKKCIGEFGLQENVTMKGYLQGEELRSAFYNADIFILPTNWGEGFPTVLAEALDAGLPIITTKIRGAADHLQEGVNGLFVPPSSSKDLATAIIKLVEDPSLRVAMRLANREKVKDFNPDIIGRKYIQIFLQILDSEKMID